MSLLIDVLVLQPLRHMMDARNKAKPMRHLIQLMEVLQTMFCFSDSRDPSLFKNIEVAVLAPPGQENTRGVKEACSIRFTLSS